MIKVIEKDLLDDNFIIKSLVSNINLNDKLYFSKENIYYFGNYNKEYLEKIKIKLIKNKKRIIKAIENGVKFIICGNSYDIFNNSFNHNDFNLFTSYNPNIFKEKNKVLKIKKKYKKNKIIKVSNLNIPIESENFKYKNLLCFK